ncbi:MAG: Cna B-type domain-containing protein [Peptostreptococcus porci]|nr:Cna B-type domain-containing protein [Peptostreptococcus porci]
MELAINWDDENNKDGIRPEAVSFQLVDGRYSYAAQMNDEGVTNSNLWTKKLTLSKINEPITTSNVSLKLNVKDYEVRTN